MKSELAQKDNMVCVHQNVSFKAESKFWQRSPPYLDNIFLRNHFYPSNPKYNPPEQQDWFEIE